jgi:hypothetical protein
MQHAVLHSLVWAICVTSRSCQVNATSAHDRRKLFHDSKKVSHNQNLTNTFQTWYRLLVFTFNMNVLIQTKDQEGMQFYTLLSTSHVMQLQYEDAICLFHWHSHEAFLIVEVYLPSSMRSFSRVWPHSLLCGSTSPVGRLNRTSDLILVSL